MTTGKFTPVSWEGWTPNVAFTFVAGEWTTSTSRLELQVQKREKLILMLEDFWLVMSFRYRFVLCAAALLSLFFFVPVPFARSLRFLLLGGPSRNQFDIAQS